MRYAWSAPYGAVAGADVPEASPRVQGRSAASARGAEEPIAFPSPLQRDQPPCNPALRRSSVSAETSVKPPAAAVNPARYMRTLIGIPVRAAPLCLRPLSVTRCSSITYRGANSAQSLELNEDSRTLENKTRSLEEGRKQL